MIRTAIIGCAAAACLALFPVAASSAPPSPFWFAMMGMATGTPSDPADDDVVDGAGLRPIGSTVCMDGPEGPDDCNWTVDHYADFGDGPEEAYFWTDPNDPWSGTPYNSECNPDYCEPGYGEEPPAPDRSAPGNWGTVR